MPAKTVVKHPPCFRPCNARSPRATLPTAGVMLQRIQYRDRAPQQIHLPFNLIVRESSTGPRAVGGHEKTGSKKSTAGSSRASTARTIA